MRMVFCLGLEPQVKRSVQQVLHSCSRSNELQDQFMSVTYASAAAALLAGGEQARADAMLVVLSAVDHLGGGGGGAS